MNVVWGFPQCGLHNDLIFLYSPLPTHLCLTSDLYIMAPALTAYIFHLKLKNHFQSEGKCVLTVYLSGGSWWLECTYWRPGHNMHEARCEVTVKSPQAATLFPASQLHVSSLPKPIYIPHNFAFHLHIKMSHLFNSLT